ncbi:acyl-CoA dehydrogenase family protein [Thauera linaloolentis]|uniref:Acyl-CoA dehydrogenase domain-containing protein n=1 Tax=Thauera linaloolentis (strain DSM 12138 / JCM 21573 / CCUG 41526 / CIP 105981 / IAM 15112 / NBRC 102519 / 47Lol) TaxID=1123367 RepID=N6YYP9_THAL4|nr:acyl-CoA dehydrogenase family protein [Thauera linaloolentis]ENO87268.1 acyl-CoA dehydrogenase domain-containing protein [Thauera linaloolentis 47Lol = DSM 12138]MCM8566718.1 acyl-CoA dehydrogenase family protein [Thauera linaloolentis]
MNPQASIDELRDRAEALRRQVRDFHDNIMPADLRGKAHRHQVLDKDDYVRWMRLLDQQGWAVAHWPREHGGLGWSPLERFAFEDELARLGCPWVIPFGVKYVGPVIYAFGSEAQKARFLPGIKSTDEFWAQGYSEPGAGSDLAGLRTTALRDGDHYVVNGQKVWTTYAQWADWLFCLVRTDRDDKPQSGISFLLIDMKSPGVKVVPIRTMDGYAHVNEVWLEDVRVPAGNLVGEEGKGWTYAKFLLKNERTAGAIVGWAWHVLDRLKRHARGTAGADGRPLIGQPLLRQRIGEYELRFLALERTAYQAVAAMCDGSENGGEASLIKIRGTELYQEVMETLVESLGHAGAAFDVRALHEAGLPPLGPDDAGGILKDHFYNRAATIFGGSSEIQRNIVAKAVLGL